MSEITSKTDIEPRLLSTDQLKHHLINVSDKKKKICF